MTQFRYVKQNYGCHCFYNDSSLKRYERYHNSGNNLIFNFGASNYGSCMPTCCGFLGGMSNWFGGLWGGMCNMFGGFGNWFGGCCSGIGNWFGGLGSWFGGCGCGLGSRGGFWGNFGAGIGMALGSGLMTLGGGLLANWLGNIGSKPSVDGTENGVKPDTEDEEVEKNKGNKVTGNAGAVDGSDTVDGSGTANGAGAVDGSSTADGAGAVDGSGAAGNVVTSKLPEGVTQEEYDAYKAIGINNDEDIKKLHDANINPETVAKYKNVSENLTADDIIKLYEFGVQPIALKESPNEYIAFNLPTDEKNLAVFLELCKDKNINVACATNPKSKDRLIYGQIGDIAKDSNGNINSYTVDCAGKGSLGYKYLVTKKPETNKWTIDVHSDSEEACNNANNAHNAQDFEYNREKRILYREGAPIVSKKYSA